MLKVWILLFIHMNLIGFNVNGIEYNIALNQTVTTSSVVAKHPATMATDQKLSTYIQVDYVQGVPAWIQFDLKLLYTATHIIIWPTNDTDFELARVSVYLTQYCSVVYDIDDYTITYEKPVRGVPFNYTIVYYDFRYIGCVYLVKDSYFEFENIKIAEVAIITLDEVSINKYYKSAPQQSNNISGAGENGPENAIDNDDTTCIHTGQSDKQNKSGWWRAELNQQFIVFSFLIGDRYTQDQLLRGNYMIYIDTDGYTKQQLCAFDNQIIKEQENEFVYCNSYLTGKFITIERYLPEPYINESYSSYALSFCFLRLYIISKARKFTNPENYIYTNATTDRDTGLDEFKNIEPNADSSLREKIIIAVVTGVIAIVISAIVFGIIGCFIGSSYQKKKNKNQVKQNNTRSINMDSLTGIEN